SPLNARKNISFAVLPSVLNFLLAPASFALFGSCFAFFTFLRQSFMLKSGGFVAVWSPAATAASYFFFASIDSCFAFEHALLPLALLSKPAETRPSPQKNWGKVPTTSPNRPPTTLPQPNGSQPKTKSPTMIPARRQSLANGCS